MDALPFEKIMRKSISQEIYEKLKERILDGDLPPGTHLLENKIAEQAGISRGPIREALRQLEADGLVEVRANIGTFVHTLSIEEVTEIYTVRSLLEGYTVTLAAEKVTQDGIEKLHCIMQAASNAAENGNVKETVKYDFDLHRQIWEMASQQILYDLLHHLEWRVQLLIALQAPLFEQLADSIQDHGLIVNAIAEGDGEQAKELIQTHIKQAGDLIIQNLKVQKEAPVKVP
jgi:DNA-binding GntR family transcriptional regulator